MEEVPYDGTYSLLLSASVNGQTYTYSANMKFFYQEYTTSDPTDPEYPEQDDLFSIYESGAVKSYGMSGFKFF